MRRYLVWVVVALAAGAAVWTGGWYYGRGKVLDRLADAETSLDAQGRTLSYAAATVEGFPLGYRLVLDEVALTDRSSGALARLPRVVGRPDPEVEGAVLADLPDRFTIRIPVPEARRTADPPLPEAITFEFTGESLLMGVPRDATIATFSGTKLAVALVETGLPHEYSVSLEGPRLALGPEKSVVLEAPALALSISGQQPDGPSIAMSLSIEDVSLEAELASAGEEPLREVIFAAADGRASVGYRLGALVVESEIRNDPLGMDGRFNLRSGAAEGEATVTAGRLDLALSAEAPAWEIAEVAEGPTGTVRADATRAEISMPMVPSTTAVPAALRLALDGVTADETLWQAVDAGALLPRDPARLTVETDMTLRLMGRIDRLPPGVAPPYEFSNIMIREIAVEAAGASASATGDIELVQPIMVPTGTIEVEAAGIQALAGRLAEAGVIDAGMLTAFEAILQVYARPGAEPDSWETEIVTGLEGIRVNGQPLQ